MLFKQTSNMDSHEMYEVVVVKNGITVAIYTSDEDDDFYEEKGMVGDTSFWGTEEEANQVCKITESVWKDTKVFYRKIWEKPVKKLT